jgi:transposase
LFALKQALDAFDFIGTQLAECDQEIEAQLQCLQAHDGEPAKGKKRGRARNAPKFDLRTQLFKMCGVDLTRIDGIDVTTALAVISETGADMSRFPTDGHFASWMGLCPGTKITGGKVMSGKTKRCANRAAQALRLAAAALRTSQSALGAYFRRMCSRMDKPKAVTAAAHKLARAYLHDAHQRPGIHRPGPGLLRAALPRTCAAATVPACPEAGDAARRRRTTGLKTPLRSITREVFLKRPLSHHAMPHS